MAMSGHTKAGISFGAFDLFVNERLLTKEGAPVELGARALDILIALISAPNEVLSKKDLMSKVWPGVTVEEGSLRFHMANLRKTLGDGKDGARYIATLPGRGYCFVAPVSQFEGRPAGGHSAAANFPQANLPARLSRMVGRGEDVLKLSADLTASRFVTIVGPGGVGKTTVAVAVAHHLEAAFSGSVLFVDLGTLTDPKLSATAVASMLGLSVQSDDAIPSLVAYLRDKRILLILDTCEHLVEAIAVLTASIAQAAPQVHILATSREALRVEGEYVYRLDSLEYPPEGLGITAAAVQEYPATQLFVERAVASGAPLIISDREAPIVADICRKLDGVALAIELAARRVESYGLQQTAALLDERLTLLWQGSRNAPPRHKTLRAALDWSYGLLSDLERVVLRRLAVFVGHFTLDAALAVVTSADIDTTQVFQAIDSLVSKSMMVTRPIGAMMRYRLLDTTRAYTLETPAKEHELADLAVRHATHYQRWLEQWGTQWPSLQNAIERAPHFAAINNVRVALEWCFGANGNAKAGVELACAATPVFLAMSLLAECHRWSERAIAALPDTVRGGRQEMTLQGTLGVSLMFMRGGRDTARLALERGLAIAESEGHALDQLRLLGSLNMFHRRPGNFNASFECAKRCSAIAATVDDPAAITLAHCVLGVSLHTRGFLIEARSELEAALSGGCRSQQTTTVYLGFEGTIVAAAILARNLWLQGYPDQAAEWALQAVEEARNMDHSLTVAIALLWDITVSLWKGDLQKVGKDTDQLMALSEPHSLDPYIFVGRGFKGELAIRQGDANAGVEALQSALQKLHALPYALVLTELRLALAQGLSALRRFDESLDSINDTIKLIEANGDLMYMPEALRVKGGILLSMAQEADAEPCFARSLALARRQGALAWELRTTTDFAKLVASHGQPEKARELLLPVFQQFTEGSDTTDLMAAGRLLDTFS
jgi:predicted ATPase/DNA-binding winged helix-turn-helix (wHTH) protein